MQLYHGDWRAAYSSRVRLPRSFAVLTDRVRRDTSLCGEACSRCVVLLDAVMHDVFSLGLLCADPKNAQLVEHHEYVELMQVLAMWWQRPLLEAALVEWVRAIRARLEEYDFWGGGFVRWPEIPWRRSGLQFLMGYMRDSGDGAMEDVIADHEALVATVEVRSIRPRSHLINGAAFAWGTAMETLRIVPDRVRRGAAGVRRRDSQRRAGGGVPRH